MRVGSTEVIEAVNKCSFRVLTETQRGLGSPVFRKLWSVCVKEWIVGQSMAFSLQFDILERVEI